MFTSLICRYWKRDSLHHEEDDDEEEIQYDIEGMIISVQFVQ
jgi:hypothetical protein